MFGDRCFSPCCCRVTEGKYRWSVASTLYNMYPQDAGYKIHSVYLFTLFIYFILWRVGIIPDTSTACHNSIILSREVGSVPTHVSFRVTLRALLLNTYKHITHKKMPARIVPGYRTTAVLPDYSFKKARMCQAYLCTFKSGVLRINSNSRYRNTHARTPPMSSGDFRG